MSICDDCLFTDSCAFESRRGRYGGGGAAPEFEENIHSCRSCGVFTVQRIQVRDEADLGGWGGGLFIFSL